MSDKMYVNSLELQWSSNSSVADFDIERDILDKLRPHRDLKELLVHGYRGTKFPDWLGHSSYKHMTHLTLNGCENCCKLPSLGQLPYLNHLCISKFDRLISIGAEFYKGDESCWKTPFPSLETLMFDELKCCQEWRSIEFNDAFPELKKLRIENCPVLIGVDEGDLPPNLRQLGIQGCEKLGSRLASKELRSHSLIHLDIVGASESVKSFPKQGYLPASLKYMRLCGFPSLETLDCRGFSHLTSLQHFDIWSCKKMENMKGERLPVSLTRLYIIDCPVLGERCKEKDPLIWPKISHIEKITVDMVQIS